MIVRARAPLRLGLAGGGTDVSPFCDLHGGCVLNTTVNLYAYATLEDRTDGQVRFVSADQGEAYEDHATAVTSIDGPLLLHKAVYRHIIAKFRDGEPLPVTMTSCSDVPPGSGLGASSSLVVAMVVALQERLGLPLGEYDVAQLAYEIERVDANVRGGRQDQYAATFGGVNFIEFYGNGRVIVNPLRIKEPVLAELDASLMLYFTGASRNSARIIDEQTSNLIAEDQRSLEAMHRLKDNALAMKEALLTGNMHRFGEIMGDSWLAKKQVADGISTEMIERVYRIAMDAGASCGKISGAGGGGFMMFLVDPVRRADVMQALAKEPGTVTICQLTQRGSESWRPANVG